MRMLKLAVVLGALLSGVSCAYAGLVLAQQPLPPPTQQAPQMQPGPQPVQPSAQEFSPNEIVDAGHRFFGGISRGLATIVEKAVSQWGLPNG